MKIKCVFPTHGSNFQTKSLLSKLFYPTYSGTHRSSNYESPDLFQNIRRMLWRHVVLLNDYQKHYSC